MNNVDVTVYDYSGDPMVSTTSTLAVDQVFTFSSTMGGLLVTATGSSPSFSFNGWKSGASALAVSVLALVGASLAF